VNWPLPSFDGSGERHKVPINMLLRWYLYDIAGEAANSEISLFNLTPVSEEGDQKETEDSEARLEAISAILPLIKLYSDMNAQYAFSTQRKDFLKIAGVTEDVLNSSSAALKSMYSHITFNGILAILAAAVELDLLEFNGIMTEIKDVEDE